MICVVLQDPDRRLVQRHRLAGRINLAAGDLTREVGLISRCQCSRELSMRTAE